MELFFRVVACLTCGLLTVLIVECIYIIVSRHREDMRPRFKHPLKPRVVLFVATLLVAWTLHVSVNWLQ